MSPLEEAIRARLCSECSDPLEEPDPDHGRDAIVTNPSGPGWAHGACAWQARLARAGAA